MDRSRARDSVAAAAVALLAFLPFLRGTWSGAALYFRDLSLQFLPLRRFTLEGLSRGEIRFWNPYVHEGVPLSLPALGYPLDVLQLLRPDEAGLSLTLALHVPFAALAALLLARHLGLDRLAAAGAAVVYALGGFLLSTVNLYVYVHAAAWAPLVVLALSRAAGRGTRRDVAFAGLLVAVSLSTTGVEIVAQAIVFGAVVGWPAARRRAAASRFAAALLLGALLAAPVLALVGGQVHDSARGRGFPTEVVLAHSVHPMTLLQVVIAGIYGNPANMVDDWWGHNFHPRGFPYVLSLYLGAPALALAAVGALGRHPRRRALALLVGLSVLLALGRFAGVAPLVDALPPLHAFRFPVKAFFTAHLGLALLAGMGLAALQSAERAAWKRLAVVAGVIGSTLLVPLAASALAPQRAAAFAARFFPTEYAPGLRLALLGLVVGDAAKGGAIAVGLAALSVLVCRGAAAPRRAAVFAVAIVAADLLRANAGLNPMVAASFLSETPRVLVEAPRLRNGRLFSCDFQASPDYAQARALRTGAHELWTFATALEMLAPDSNVPLRVPTALSIDKTMLAPEQRVFTPDEVSCADPGSILPRLREAGVDHVLSAAPLAAPGLRLERVVSPPRIAPLELRLYALDQPAPFAELRPQADRLEATAKVAEISRSVGRIELAVAAESPSTLVVREGWAVGWRAEVDGRAAAVQPTADSHCSVALAPGRHRVRLRFLPPGLPPALAASGVALLAMIWLARPRRPRLSR